MRAIILSAGQGKRLLPLTEKTPKCLLPVQGETTVLDLQLRTLAACGVDEASVIVGFGADQVEEHLAAHPTEGIDVRTVFNPFYAQSDNLATAWLARSEMTSEFLLLNGDTLFEAEVLRRLLASPNAPLALSINVKDHYDDDDMKVVLNGGRRLAAVGKTLSSKLVGGESIGLMLFRGAGAEAFRNALDAAIREPKALALWYLSVVNGLTDTLRIETVDISGLWWGELDGPEDLTSVRRALARRTPKARKAGPPSRYAE
jgi:choline kinase